MSLHPRRRVVRAASGIELVTIPSVELLEVGMDWETSTGVFSFTEEDLQSAVDAMSDPSIRTPVAKFGHTDPRFDGDFSVGRYDNLRLVNNGMTLAADHVGVPRWLAEIMAAAYPRRSIEGRWDWETYTGNRWKFYLTAVALLGAQYPAIATIDDIRAFWAGEPVEYVEVAASDGDPPYAIHAERGTMMRANQVEGAAVPIWKKEPKVEGSVEVTDLIRQFYDSLDAAQSWWWVRAVQVDPPQLIVDDDEGSLYRVAYTISGDTITFAEAVKVKVEYQDVPADKSAAAKAVSWEGAGVAATYPTRVASRGAMVSPRASHTPEDTMNEAQKALIGLPADATDEQVTAKLTELAPSASEGEKTDPPTSTPATPGTSAPAGSPGDPTEPAPEAPAPTTEPAKPEASSVPAGMVLVDEEAWRQVQETTKNVAAKMATDESTRRASIISAAIKEGKIPPSRKPHYEALMAAAPKETEELIANMAAGLVPVDATVGVGDGDVAGGEPIEAYPPGWLPEVQARQNGSGRPPTIVTEA